MKVERKETVAYDKTKKTLKDLFFLKNLQS